MYKFGVYVEFKNEGPVDGRARMLSKRLRWMMENCKGIKLICVEYEKEKE